MRSREAARLLAIIVMGFGFWCQATELAYKAAPPDNPLKGIVPTRYGTAARSFPHSLEYLEIALADVITGPRQFDWKIFDQRLAAISRDGKQAVVRFYLDWPGRTNTIPNFLTNATRIVTVGVWRQGERVPDYDAPIMRAALTNFIAEFGSRYDGDPDLAFVEAGLLGAWGEWSGGGAGGSAETLKEILNAYDLAFHKTKVLARYPTAFSIQRNFGYHDDWFGHKNGGLQERFASLGITNALFWKTAPMGGRVHPEIQKAISKVTAPSDLNDAQLDEARAGHFTYLRIGDQNALQPRTPNWNRAVKLSQAIGYEFYAARAEVSFDQQRSSVNVQVRIKNTGIAPFYYTWPVEVGLASEGSLKQKWNVDWDVRRVMPGDDGIEFRSEEMDVSVPAATYRVLIRILNPAARGRPISFANETQDADVEGWLTLGRVTVGP
jgi:hypothetical protein